ncbi:helix-turn-helix domain-containing protein [Erythrobacter donghaensis]|uniref:helix-turn-helix domain-containing protein n=1 Tax=Erythrobacter donghaensis TaxID=267135 RepID=UPI0009BDF628
MEYYIPVALALKRFRRLSGTKQSFVASELGITQGTLSRWETGRHAPDNAQRARIIEFLRKYAPHQTDSLVESLVQNSKKRVLLVCDSTHRLLAASKSMSRPWQGGVNQYLNCSLWRYATDEIIEAEKRLRDIDWYDKINLVHEFWTEGNKSTDVPIPPAKIRWETLMLAHGFTGRLVQVIE